MRATPSPAAFRSAISTTMSSVVVPRLADVEQLDVEDERRVGRNDATGAAGAVPHAWRNRQRALTADLHPGHALIPAGNDLTATEPERERLVAIAGTVEFAA